MTSEIVAVPLVSSSSSNSPQAQNNMSAYHVEVIKKHGECPTLEAKDIKPPIISESDKATSLCPWTSSGTTSKEQEKHITQKTNQQKSQQQHQTDINKYGWIKSEPQHQQQNVKVKEEDTRNSPHSPISRHSSISPLSRQVSQSPISRQPSHSPLSRQSPSSQLLEISHQMLPPEEPISNKSENFIHPRDIIHRPPTHQRSYTLSIREDSTIQSVPHQNLSEVMPPPEPLIRSENQNLHLGSSSSSSHGGCPIVSRGQGKKNKKKEEDTDVTSSIPDLGE